MELEPSKVGDININSSQPRQFVSFFDLMSYWFEKLNSDEPNPTFDIPACFNQNHQEDATGGKNELMEILLSTSAHSLMENCALGSKFSTVLWKHLESRFKIRSVNSGTRSKERGSRLPLQLINLVSQEMAFSDEIQSLSLKSDFALIKNLVEVCGIDKDTFSADSLASSGKRRMKIELRRQKYQKPNINLDSTGMPTWKFSSSPGKMPLSEYAEYFNEQDTHEQTKKFLSFGTNLDLKDGDVAWASQLNELSKLPVWMQHNARSSYIAEQFTQIPILGVNEVQAYMKVVGSRTPGHQEHGNSTSININFGPGISTWFGTERKSFPLLEEILKEKGLTFSTNSWWPILEDLKASGINYYEFQQYEGDAVVVNVGAPHWVQCDMKCINVAWNIAPFTNSQLEGFDERSYWDMMDDFATLIPMHTITRNVLKNPDVLNKADVDCKKQFLIQAAAMLQRIQYQISQVSATAIEEGEFLRKTQAMTVPPLTCHSCGNQIIYHVLAEKSKEVRRNKSEKFFCVGCSLNIDSTLSAFEYETEFDLPEFLESYDMYRNYLNESLPQKM